MILDVKVIPNAKDDKLQVESGKLIIHVTQPPSKGKANLQVIKMIERRFNVKATIIRGAKSRLKKVLIEGKTEELEKLLKM